MRVQGRTADEPHCPRRSATIRHPAMHPRLAILRMGSTVMVRECMLAEDVHDGKME
jgi:hypothetical protein